MAATLATVKGIALRPGVSLNKRLYSRELIAAAVARAQERIAAGESLNVVDASAQPLTQKTHHDAEDDSTRIVGRITKLSLDGDGAAHFEAAIAPTAAGRTIATLLDTSDGQPPYLRGVSIRGAWLGQPHEVTAPSGERAVTGAALELDGLDYTGKPGVPGAQVTSFEWVDGKHPDEAADTDERVLITESVQEAQVTFTETTEGAPGADGANTPAEPPDGVMEAVRAILAPPEAHVLDNGLCVTCERGATEKKGGKTPYGNVTYADPGYQSDGVKRYPLDIASHIRSAWSYINMPKNAAKYTSDQIKRIKGRIKAAMKRIGAKVSTEAAGWTFGEPFQVTEAVAEWYGDDPKRPGSWSVSASNGPVNLNLSSYCMDPADLDVILRAAADAACKALAALDPDMDGDVDVPGTDGDTDHDAGHENAPDPDDPATESTAEDPAPAGDSEQEESVMAESSNSTSGAGATPGLTAEAIGEATATAVAKVFEARDAAKAKAKADAKAAQEREAAEKRARKDALTEALAELGIKVPTPGAGNGGGGGTVTERAASGEGGTGGDGVSEAVREEAQKIAKEMFTEFVQEAHASGAILPGRSGFTVREHAVPDADNAPSGDDLRKMSDDALFDHMGGAMAQHADQVRPVGAPA